MDRIQLLSSDLIPNEGNRLLLGLIIQAREKIVLNEAELTAIEYKANGESFRYNIKKALELETEIFLPRRIAEAIWANLQQLDRTSKLTPLTDCPSMKSITPRFLCNTVPTFQ